MSKQPSHAIRHRTHHRKKGVKSDTENKIKQNLNRKLNNSSHRTLASLSLARHSSCSDCVSCPRRRSRSRECETKKKN